ncbi:MAG: SseB family protein [Proteobacteria bacterium]|nr:SseB family protein [Pseudomonadota bacterium]
MTPLDTALSKAMNEVGKVEAFYNLLMQEEVLVPVSELPVEEPGAVNSADGMSIKPVIVDHDGQPTLMLFDTEDRLSDWAEGEMAFVGLQGHVVFTMIDGDYQVVLNPGQELHKVFGNDEVQWLHDVATGAPPAPQRENDNSRIGLPANLPAGLVACLETEIPKWADDIEHAYIFGLEPDISKPEYVIVVGLVRGGYASLEQTILEGLADALTNAVTRGPFPIDIQFLEAGSAELEIVMELTGPTVSN